MNDHDTFSPPVSRPRTIDIASLVKILGTVLTAALAIGAVVYAAGRQPSRDEFEEVEKKVHTIQLQQTEMKGDLARLGDKVDVAGKLDQVIQAIQRQESSRKAGQR